MLFSLQVQHKQAQQKFCSERALISNAVPAQHMLDVSKDHHQKGFSLRPFPSKAGPFPPTCLMTVCLFFFVFFKLNCCY